MLPLGLVSPYFLRLSSVTLCTYIFTSTPIFHVHVSSVLSIIYVHVTFLVLPAPDIGRPLITSHRRRVTLVFTSTYLVHFPYVHVTFLVLPAPEVGRVARVGFLVGAHVLGLVLPAVAVPLAVAAPPGGDALAGGAFEVGGWAFAGAAVGGLV